MSFMPESSYSGRLPDGVKDDAAAAEPSSLTTSQFRLAVTRDFAADDLYARAAQRPVALAALIFNTELQKVVLKTKGALNYESEITCLIITKASDEQIFSIFPCQRGSFSTSKVPRWRSGSSDGRMNYQRHISNA